LTDDNTCEDHSLHAPFAYFNDDWKSVEFFYPEVGYFLRYKSGNLNTCKDGALTDNWNSPGFNVQL